MSDPQDQPKTTIDEDWKSKVQAEKEALRNASETTPGAERAEKSPPVPATPAAELDDLPGELPPASFTTLVTMLATQAMVALGQIPDPVQDKPVVRLNFARHYIDTLSMLEEKTKGQLAADEAALLEHVLYDLRLTFVTVKKVSGS